MHQKPRILCFHGLGSNAEIFQAQTYQLRHRLEAYFELVYLNGPYECEPGPGVLPIFEGCGPYYRWTEDHEEAYDESSYDHSGWDRSAGLRSVLDQLEPPISSSVWAGVIGFSHGGRIAAGLLKQQSLRTLQSYANPTPDELAEFAPTRFQFGVFFHTAYPPLEFPVATRLEYPDCIIQVPSVHVHGLQDPSLDIQQRMVSHFQRERREVIQCNVGHWIPSQRRDVEAIIDKILSISQPAGWSSERHGIEPPKFSQHRIPQILGLKSVG
ncbi:oxidoreductase [Colletotrichum incanum]|uniref:Oxidoreductase n=1 Tax=Colletotrichum incanum TaxID=1573173 RepID=A0A167D1R6_COLIC|nr:oxidoreductase [Colletotrichum incanum]